MHIQMNSYQTNNKKIVISNLSKKYKDKLILKDIDLHVYEDEIVSIIGPSGCGKSTLASMLMRFIDPKEGYLYFEGECYYNKTPNELRKKIIMVPQKVNIFSGSLEDNLKVAKEDASISELLDVLKQVHLYDWVK